MIDLNNIKDDINDFVEIYNNRPIKYNPHGTESPLVY